jgi:hypothetical protein
VVNAKTPRTPWEKSEKEELTAAGVDDSLEAILQQDDVEIDEEAEPKPDIPQVGE